MVLEPADDLDSWETEEGCTCNEVPCIEHDCQCDWCHGAQSNRDEKEE